MDLSYFTGDTHNSSFTAIAAAWAVAQLIGTRWTLRFKGLDQNRLPRDSIGKAEKKADPKFVDYVKRRTGAHYNGLENLAVFVGAVVAGNMAHLPVSMMNTFAWSYVGLRVIYSILYATIDDEILATARTVIWWWAQMWCFLIYYRAQSKGL